MGKLWRNNFLIGNEVTFGRYRQSDNPDDGMEKIRWVVLARKGNKALLLSKYSLVRKPYHSINMSQFTTWENCYLRKWLNTDFLNTAFTPKELEAILDTRVDNSREQENPAYNTNGGNDTVDKVFLLSYKEAFVDYFKNNTSRLCQPTAYAGKHGTYEDETENCWWLRSPGLRQDDAICVYYNGSCEHDSVYRDDNYVRPVLWVNLEAEAFKEYEIEEISFGRYLQSDNPDDGKEKIQWLVLAREENRALLLSKYGLDVKPYHPDLGKITWEESDVRNWLNADFINAAFSKNEQRAILETNVDNSWRQGFSDDETDSQNDTVDKVFFLSYKEVFEEYFEDDVARICRPTAYALKRGAYVNEVGNCWWWLRSPGYRQKDAVYVDYDGLCDSDYISYDDTCIRPALWVDLNSEIFENRAQ